MHTDDRHIQNYGADNRERLGTRYDSMELATALINGASNADQSRRANSLLYGYIDTAVGLGAYRRQTYSKLRRTQQKETTKALGTVPCSLWAAALPRRRHTTNTYQVSMKRNYYNLCLLVKI